MNEFAFDHHEEYKLLPGLQNHTRVNLGPIRTPLEKLQRLGDELGIQLFAKRDDTQPLAMGGNKVRQLEFYLGPAQDQGADTVLITGAVQSNFVRLCTAACRKLGWHPIVQLEDRVPKDDLNYKNSGNVLLDHMLGAEVYTFPEGEDESAADANLDRLADEVRTRGGVPYVIHLGTNHPPLGGLGYALGAVETKLQLDSSANDIDHIVIGSGSGLTHAGFLSGARASGWNVPVHGICVRRAVDLQRPRILQRTKEVLKLLDCPHAPLDDDIKVYDEVFKPGYGLLNDQVREAIKLAAHKEALLLDPVYTGRSMAGLIDLVRRGIISKGDRVLFVHTGGTPGIFAYQSELMQ